MKDLVRRGAGPLVFSTSTVIQPFPLVKWDVNGYYRDLGVSVEATKKEMVDAYTEAQGHEDARRTYVLKQLLNSVIRRKYDAVPLGSVFVDRYILEGSARFLEASEERAPEVLDSPPSSLDNGEASFSYYQLRTTCSERARLERLREGLVQHLGERGEAYRLAVGFHASVEFVKLINLDSHVAVLLADYVEEVDHSIITKVERKLQRMFVS